MNEGKEEKKRRGGGEIKNVEEEMKKIRGG